MSGASARMSRSSRTWPTPSSTSGRAGSPASAAFSVRIRWQKLWKFDTAMRARTVGADRRVQPVPQLARGLHVVGQHEDLLGQQVLARRQQMPDALDDDPRLARPGARDDDDRPVAPLDDPPLLGGQVVVRRDHGRHSRT